MTLPGRFPDDIARGAEGGHGHFKTTIVVGHGGHEDRNQEWQDAKGRWTVGRAIELNSAHETARAHFYRARGALHDWRFKDWHDFTATRAGTDRGRLTGATTAWQINKVYGTDDATHEYIRPLHRIVAGTLQVWRNASLQTVSTHYTVNMDTGVLTSLSSWAGDTLEVACQFDVLCRYEIDEFNASLLYRRSDAAMHFRWDGIAIVEVRE